MLKNPLKLKSKPQHLDRCRGKRIFVGFNFAGTAGIWAFTRVLRRRGYKIDFYGMNRPNFNMPLDITLKFSQNPIKAFWERFSYFWKILPKYDVWHFNYGKTFFFYPLNLLILKLWGKKIVCTFRGSDVRASLDFLPEPETLYDERFNWPEWYKTINQMPFLQKWQKTLRMLIFYWFSDQVVLTGPFLAGSVVAFDKIIPYARNIKTINRFAKKNTSDKLTILHVPSKESVKGTDQVRIVFKSLAKKYPLHRFIIKNNLSHEALLRAMGRADIIIDQLLVGWYGGQAVEAMALGKPVLSFIYPSYLGLVDFGPEVPVVNTNYWALAHDLESLLVSPQLREDLGRRGLEFVAKHHDATKIAEDYQKTYEIALNK